MIKLLSESIEDAIIKKVCDHLELTPGIIKEKHRMRSHCMARAIIAYNLMVVHRLTAEYTGSIFGRSHCWAIHSREVCKTLYMDDYMQLFPKDTETLIKDFIENKF